MSYPARLVLYVQMEWGVCISFVIALLLARELWSMVFGLFRVQWVMPRSVVDPVYLTLLCPLVPNSSLCRGVEQLGRWQGHFGRHQHIAVWQMVPHCVMWCICMSGCQR